MQVEKRETEMKEKKEKEKKNKQLDKNCENWYQMN